MTYHNCTRVPSPPSIVPNSNLVSRKTCEREHCDGGDDRTTKNNVHEVQTLTKARRQQELLLSTEQNKIDIISIQEHRIFHPDSALGYKNLGKYQLITASASKNSQGSTIGGVGILLSPKASDNLLSVEQISDCIIIAEFNSNPKTTFIACYSPTNVSEELLADDFYHDLSGFIESVPAHNFLVIAGDFNGQLGPEDALFTYNKKTNRNGEKC